MSLKIQLKDLMNQKSKHNNIESVYNETAFVFIDSYCAYLHFDLIQVKTLTSEQKLQ